MLNLLSRAFIYALVAMGVWISTVGQNESERVGTAILWPMTVGSIIGDAYLARPAHKPVQ